MCETMFVFYEPTHPPRKPSNCVLKQWCYGVGSAGNGMRKAGMLLAFC